MVRLTDHPECRRASHDRATPSVELPCCAAASSPAAQTSMSACARRASACAKRPNQSAHTLALYPMCRGSRTGTSRGCTGFAPGVGHRWPWHGATGTESEIWRVVNQPRNQQQHGPCAPGGWLRWTGCPAASQASRDISGKRHLQQDQGYIVTSPVNSRAGVGDIHTNSLALDKCLQTEYRQDFLRVCRFFF